jgi:hypothetical protein
MNASKFIKNVAILLLIFSIIPIARANADSDPIPAYLAQIDLNNLINVATDLVIQFGPRHVDFNSPYLDDSCTPDNSIVYSKSNFEMSADYVKGLFEAMGYPSESITMEELPGGGEHNVYVTKVGSSYPNIFIEFSGHLDSVNGSPGGADNASGSTAVIELARVLKDFPNRYSMRFILWAAEEYSVPRGAAYNGSTYHVQQVLARGEQIKAGLVMDHIGWPYPSDPTGYMNEISYIDPESERIADLFDQVRTQYGIQIGFGKDQGIQNSDEHSYWDADLTAVSSGGGWLYYRPNYHSCGDTVENIDFNNVLRAAQQNLAVGLLLDAEDPGGTSSTIDVQVVAGWNLLALPLQPQPAMIAQSLLDSLNAQSSVGNCSEVDQWNNSAWESYNILFGGTNFQIVPGRGYFIYCATPFDWMVQGETFQSGVPLDLLSGWNLIGVPYPETYTSPTLLTAIGADCLEIDRWFNSAWYSYNTLFGGDNFNILSQEGYFLYCIQENTFNP